MYKEVESITHLRTLLKMTQIQFAEAISCRQCSVSNWESGLCYISMNNLKKGNILARANGYILIV